MVYVLVYKVESWYLRSGHWQLNHKRYPMEGTVVGVGSHKPNIT
jgi:hypothetical protein